MVGFEAFIGKFVNRAVGQVANAQTDPLAASVFRWFGNFQEHVMRKWYPITRANLACSVKQKNPATGKFEPCPHVAIGACCFCRHPTCLHHAMVNHVAEIACFRCMVECVQLMKDKHPEWQARPDIGANGSQSAPPASQEAVDLERRRRYLKVLGLKDPTTWDEIHATFRELSIKLHPDRAPTPAKRVQAEKKFKALSEAYSWFSEKRERAVAA